MGILGFLIPISRVIKAFYCVVYVFMLKDGTVEKYTTVHAINGRKELNCLIKLQQFNGI